MPYIGPGDVHPGSIFLPSHAMTPSPTPSRSSHHSHISHHHHHRQHASLVPNYPNDSDPDADVESSQEIFKIFPSLSPQTDIRRINLENYLLTFPLDHGTPGQVSLIELGKLGEGVRSVVRLTREKLFWLSPRVGRREEGVECGFRYASFNSSAGTKLGHVNPAWECIKGSRHTPSHRTRIHGHTPRLLIQSQRRRRDNSKIRERRPTRRPRRRLRTPLRKTHHLILPLPSLSNSKRNRLGSVGSWHRDEFIGA